MTVGFMDFIHGWRFTDVDFISPALRSVSWSSAQFLFSLKNCPIVVCFVSNHLEDDSCCGEGGDCIPWSPVDYGVNTTVVLIWTRAT